MPDVHDIETRSYNMSMIKGKNTKPEIIVRKYLFAKGYRFRVNYSRLPGKPDIVLPKYRLIIFINGCFWHGHENCKYFVIPKTRTKWWLEKIETNKKRDDINERELLSFGWKVKTIWECELKAEKLDNTMKELLMFLI